MLACLNSSCPGIFVDGLGFLNLETSQNGPLKPSWKDLWISHSNPSLLEEIWGLETQERRGFWTTSWARSALCGFVEREGLWVHCGIDAPVISCLDWLDSAALMKWWERLAVWIFSSDVVFLRESLKSGTQNSPLTGAWRKFSGLCYSLCIFVLFELHDFKIRLLYAACRE